MLKSIESSLEGLNVRWCTDNKNIVKIIKAGSRKSELQQKAVEIHEICEKGCVQIDPVWIPRKENKRADIFSRIVDSDDWQINWQTFSRLSKKLGPYTCDRFACDYNAKCPKYNSR